MSKKSSPFVKSVSAITNSIRATFWWHIARRASKIEKYASAKGEEAFMQSSMDVTDAFVL